MIYATFNYALLPRIVAIWMAISACVGIVVFHLLFSLATELHLQSAKIISVCSEKLNPFSDDDKKFWEAMNPLTFVVGSVCSFESREFTLFIWREVVIATVIDLLIAF